jgi:hypothetical protein
MPALNIITKADVVRKVQSIYEAARDRGGPQTHSQAVENRRILAAMRLTMKALEIVEEAVIKGDLTL